MCFFHFTINFVWCLPFLLSLPPSFFQTVFFCVVLTNLGPRLDQPGPS